MRDVKKFAAIFLLAWFSTSFPAKAQNLDFQHFTTENGLSNNSVSIIYQDSKGFIWIGTRNGLNRFDGYQFKSFVNHQNDINSISNNSVNDLCEDGDGDLWIGTNGGLNRFSPPKQSFTNYRHNELKRQSISHNRVVSVYNGGAGIIWVGTRSGLEKLDIASGEFITYPIPGDQQQNPWFEVSAITKIDSEEDLIIGTWGGGIYHFNRTTSVYTPIEAEGLSMPIWVNDFFVDQDNVLWAALSSTDTYRYNRERRSFEIVRDEPFVFRSDLQSILVMKNGKIILGRGGNGISIVEPDLKVAQDYPLRIGPANLYDGWINSIMEDREGGIWLGKMGGGISRFSPHNQKFLTYKVDRNDPRNLSSNLITDIEEMQDGSIWVASRWDGINIYTPGKPGFSHLHKGPGSLSSDEIMSLHQDRQGRIWIGTWGSGMNMYDPPKNEFYSFRPDSTKAESLISYFVSDFCETTEDELWIATPHGISVLDINDWRPKKFKNYFHDPKDHRTLSYPRANVILEDSKKNIWIGSEQGGLNLFDRATDSFIHLRHDPYDSASLGSDRILDIFEDSHQQLWIGTFGGGLNRYDYEKNTFSAFSQKAGLPSNEIMGIVEDHRHQLWLATGKGLSSYHMDNDQLTNYFKEDGLAGNDMQPRTILFSKRRNEIWAGSQSGITRFNTDSLLENVFIPPIEIISIQKYYKGDDTPLPVTNEVIPGKDKTVVLAHQENIITIEFAALSFDQPGEQEYAYQLEGYNDDWIYLGNKREVTFTSLGPGNYIFRVKGSNDDKVWNEEGTSLKIIVKPPWWRTNLAWLCWVTLLISILHYLNQIRSKRKAAKVAKDLQLEEEKLKRENLQELDQLKSRFYSSITHEFRTPLTLILGLSDSQHLQNGNGDDRMEVIHRNGENMLRLVDQLLTLSRLETGSIPIHPIQGDIIVFLRQLLEPFYLYAAEREIMLELKSNLDALSMDFDPEILGQILTNLLSNAIKFTPPGGQILLIIGFDAADQQLHFKITDTGVGIPEEDLPSIFDRYYQSPSTQDKHVGTGIGLAHARELARLIGGDISVESELGVGSSFSFHLPINHSLSGTGNDDLKINRIKKEDAADAPIILIIEDNQDIIDYLHQCLSPMYHVEIASDGHVGVQKAFDLIPDLIISDVMLPGINGLEICKTLKIDQRTSHIPIVLLTAKSSAASKLEGLRQGADVYLTKPFQLNELLVQLNNLLEQRAKLQAYYKQEARSNTGSDQPIEAGIEDQFIRKVKDILEKNLSDEDFGLPGLCEAIGMSRSQLFRKMKALIEEAPSHFIRMYRLQRARELLESTDLPVSQIAYQVGFKDPAYFSFAYHEAFGMTPSLSRTV